MHKREALRRTLINWVLLPLCAVFFLGPIVLMFVQSFQTDGTKSLTLDNYVFLSELKPVLKIALNSIIISGITTLTTVCFGSMAGYALAKLRFFGRELLLAVVLISVMFPYMSILCLSFL